MDLLGVLLAIVFVLIVAYIVCFNMFVSRKQKVREAWSDVDVQLKRRRDLIPNIVNTVKGYAKQEKDLLEKVTQERAEANETKPSDLKRLGSIEGAIQADLSAILMIAEAYPDLKANQNFLKLQEELTETEDQIASSRRIYNANVAAYNTLIQVFPLNVVAKLGGFKESSFLEFTDIKTVPSAKMN